VAPERDPLSLEPASPPMEAGAPPSPETTVVGLDEVLPEDPVELFRQRATSLGVDVRDAVEPRDGDRVVEAAAGIANTGSVLLVGDAAARRPLLGAKRVVVRLDRRRIVG